MEVANKDRHPRKDNKLRSIISSALAKLFSNTLLPSKHPFYKCEFRSAAHTLPCKDPGSHYLRNFQYSYRDLLTQNFEMDELTSR